MVRRNLVEILGAGVDRDRIRRNFLEAKPAHDFGKPLPPGKYVARLVSGDLFNASTGTPGYKLTFEIVEGEFAHRKVWLDLWLSDRAIPGTKRDLIKLGVTSLDQLDHPLPQGIRCRVVLSLRHMDDGTEHNDVKTFDVLGIDRPEMDPFAPPPADDVAGTVPPSPPTNTTVTSPLSDEKAGGTDHQTGDKNGGAA